MNFLYMDDLTYTLNPITTELGVGPTREMTKSVENKIEISRHCWASPHLPTCCTMTRKP